eukprot:6466525-Amphidinium_carterae.1
MSSSQPPLIQLLQHAPCDRYPRAGCGNVFDFNEMQHGGYPRASCCIYIHIHVTVHTTLAIDEITYIFTHNYLRHHLRAPDRDPHRDHSDIIHRLR